MLCHSRNYPRYYTPLGPNTIKYPKMFFCILMLHHSKVKPYLYIFSDLRDLENPGKHILGPFPPFRVRISKNPFLALC